ncbi:MAG: hypothetical protein ACLFPF_10925 [Halanaerobiales bacterium]
MEINLTLDEIKVLRDALEEWKVKGEKGEMMMDLMSAVIGGMAEDDNEDLDNKLEQDRQQRRAEFENKKQRRIEIAEEIDEKLIIMRRKVRSSLGDEGSVLSRSATIDELCD